MTKPAILRPTPEEQIPSTGSTIAILGCIGLIVFVILTFVLVAFTAGHILESDSMDQQDKLIGGGVAVVWVGLLLVLIRKKYTVYPNGIDVLRDVLNFDVTKCFCGVTLTAFTRPSELRAGEATSLLIFLQNYSGKKKRIKVKLGKSPAFQNVNSRSIQLEIGPGQCAVYRECFLVPATCKPQQHTIRLIWTIKGFPGFGERIIPRSRKEPTISLTYGRASTLLLDVAPADTNEALLNESGTQPGFEYISVYTPTLPEPRFDLLEKITHSPPGQSIRSESGS